MLILITVSPLKGGLDFQEKAGRFFEEFSFFQEKEQAGKALSKADQERMGAFLAEYKKRSGSADPGNRAGGRRYL